MMSLANAKLPINYFHDTFYGSLILGSSDFQLNYYFHELMQTRVTFHFQHSIDLYIFNRKTLHINTFINNFLDYDFHQNNNKNSLKTPILY